MRMPVALYRTFWRTDTSLNTGQASVKIPVILFCLRPVRRRCTSSLGWTTPRRRSSSRTPSMSTRHCNLRSNATGWASNVRPPFSHRRSTMLIDARCRLLWHWDLVDKRFQEEIKQGSREEQSVEYGRQAFISGRQTSCEDQRRHYEGLYACLTEMLLGC